jgi:ferredoxin
VVFHGTVVATEEGPESTRLMRVEVDERIAGALRKQAAPHVLGCGAAGLP